MVTTERGPRAQVRDWVAEHIDPDAPVSLPDLTEQAAEHFSHDRAFVKQVLQEALYTWVYEQARLVLRRLRGGKEPVLLGSALLTREQLQAHAKERRSRWEVFLEKANAGHINLLSMTREDLDFAIAEREQQIETSQTYIRLFRRLRESLRPGETVGDCFTPEQIDAIFQAVAPATIPAENTEKVA